MLDRRHRRHREPDTGGPTGCRARSDLDADDASGARTRVRHAGFPALKTFEEFDWSAQPSAERPLLLHLAQLVWIEEHKPISKLKRWAVIRGEKRAKSEAPIEVESLK